MLTATVRSMLAHKLRLFLTVTSIALGVAFLAGTLMLTDTTNKAFTQLLGGISAGTDSVVRQESAFSSRSGAGTSSAPLPESVLADVRSVDGVAAAEGAVNGYALLLDPDGGAILSTGGAPTLGYSMTTDEALRGDVQLRSGRAPAAPGEVAIDVTSAEGHAVALGDRVSVLFRGPRETFTVVGTVGYGSENDLGGSTAAYFDTATAQRVLGTPGAFDEIVVRGAGDLDEAAVTDRVAAVLPDGAEALTGTAVAREAADAFAESFSIVRVLFLVFAGIALFVGSFIIWNTFTMVVAQRSREIALLRAIGATRRQVLRNLLAEAALLGFGASALGVALGAAFATGLQALMGALGASMPSTSLQVLPRTVVVGLLVGTLVTVLAALVPARRATTVLPVEALRDSAVDAAPPSRLRRVLGACLAAGGVSAVVVGLVSDTFPLVGLGLVAVLGGVLTLAAVGVGALAGMLGAPLRLRGTAGQLARQNAMRNPRRTAATATALMIGLSLVVGIGVFASSLQASIAPLLENSTKADLFVQPVSAQAEGFSPDAARLVAAAPGVAVASPTSWGEMRVNGVDAFFSSIDPATVDAVLDLEVVAGSAAALGTDGVLVGAQLAAENGWTVGSVVDAEFAATGTTPLQVQGLYEGTGYLGGEYLISIAAHEARVPYRLDTGVLVGLEAGADLPAVQDAISAALLAQPDAKVLTPRQFAEERAGVVKQLLTLMTVLLLLAVVIALLGIVNTLALSVHERTRELGLLRAVGMTTGQVRAMVRWESVLISLIGGAAGAGLGLGLGAALTQAAKGDVVTVIDVPIGTIAVYVALAVLAGVVAAIGPARSASRVDVLRAVVTE
jgi:putative ABC transport system permease protein